MEHAVIAKLISDNRKSLLEEAGKHLRTFQELAKKDQPPAIQAFVEQYFLPDQTSQHKAARSNHRTEVFSNLAV